MGDVSKRAAAMSPKLIATLVVVGTLGLVAIALTIAPPALYIADFRADPEGANFNNAFAAAEAAFIQHPEILNPAFTQANREILRLDALRRMNLDYAIE
jgi:hypothetical protein